VEAIVDSAASAPVVGKRLAIKIGIWKRARKVNVKQGYGSTLSEGNYVVYSSFRVYSKGSLLGKFSLDAEVLDIGKKDVILGLSWLVENGFMVDTQERCLRNVKTGLVIPCSVKWIPSVTLIDIDVEPIVDGDVLLILNVRKRYNCYAQVFSAEQAARLPEHKPWDHQIPLIDPHVRIPTRAIYKTIWEQDEALQNYLKSEVPTGKVRRSRSSTGTPILFVCKKDGTLRICVDYRALNRLTIPNKYPLPLISELLDKTKGGKLFTRLDLKNVYNLLRIAVEDEWKTTFRTKKGLFEYTVMPFGLMNAPASFQEMMDTIFKDVEGCV